MANENVVIERNGQKRFIVLRGDEAVKAARRGSIKWGSGPRWTVLYVGDNATCQELLRMN